MTSSSLERRSEAGVSMISLMAVMGVGMLAFFFMEMSGTLSKTATDKIRGSRSTLALESAADTLLLAYRLAEKAYNLQMGSCTSDTSRPFMTALDQGHGCSSGVATITVFNPGVTVTPGDADGVDISQLFDYTHSSGCTITQSTGLTCDGLPPPFALITIGAGAGANQLAQKIDGGTYAMKFSRAIAQKEIAEFSAVITPKTGQVTSRNLAIRATLSNLAHLETDGRVTQESPDPTALCKGTPWGTYMLYDAPSKKCQSFAQIGGGSGLAYYKGRYFGFRPGDGLVVDLMAASTSPGYLVDPATGETCAGCGQVFPPYDQDSLRDADDITLVGDDVYYVAGSGAAAQIGAVSLYGSVQPIPALVPATAPGTASRVPICPLGAMGWGQAYMGISSVDWSETILPTSVSAPHQVSATFFLKTDTGSMLTATVLSKQGTAPTSFPVESCTTFTFSGSNYWSCCLVFKDGQIQQPEYLRTFGFERAAETKPYYLY